MSMVCSLRQASDETIEHLRAHQEEIQFFLYGPESQPKPSFFARLFGKKEEPADTREWTPPAEDEEIYLDKAWNGLHYLFTLTDFDGEPPLCYLVKGGKEIGAVDVGYGPARALSSAEVDAFYAALSAITPEELKARYDPQKMMELSIYPTIWDRSEDPEEKDDPLDYLMEYYAILMDFLRKSTEKRVGLIVYYN